jgi:hypothetical protein
MVELDVLVETEMRWGAQSYFESERSELDPPGFHSYQPAQLCLLSELEVVGHSHHSHHEIWGVEVRLTPSSSGWSSWTFVSRADRVGEFE